MLRPKVFNYKNEFLAQSTMLEQAIKFFIVFFVVVEPISLIPVFSGLTEGASNAYKHKMALKSVLVASGILLLFALAGAGFESKACLIRPGWSLSTRLRSAPTWCGWAGELREASG